MSIVLNPLGTYRTGVFDEGAQEINAYDPETQRLFVVNADATTIDVLDLSDPANPVQVGSINASALGAGANSVAVKDGLVAVAIEADPATDPGKVAFFNADETDFANPSVVAEVTVGALPDMVAFTPDGTKLVVANEGEPDDGIDPDGSVSIIDIAMFTAQKATFDTFNAQQAELQAAGLRLFPGKTLAADVEPEYVAITPDGAQAYVTLQEANAVAVVDINTATVTDIQPLQPIDHSQAGNGLDPSDRDAGVTIQTWPVWGLQMPDAIATYEANGETYYVTANEGDDRGDANEDASGDAIRLKDLADVTSFGRTGLELDASITDAYPNIADDDQLGRLTISSLDGDTDGDGDIDQIHAYGSRSFSIFDSQGNLVFNSGDDFERITADAFPDDFNANNDENDSFESRSDNKGPEPEGVTLGEIDGQTYAFIGLERVGGIMVYNVTDPANASFVSYLNNRDFSVDAELTDGSTNPEVGDLAPEGLTFIAADESPNGNPLLAVSNEVSGTTTLYGIESPAGAASDLVISGVIDGPLSGGVPKAIELYAVNDIADLSSYGLGGANNGGGSDGQELTLSGSVNAGEYLYIASESPGFEAFFGFAPDFTSNAASINGDDAIELFKDGEVVDLFGDIDVDGSGEPWEYQDGWAYRKPGTGPDGNTFELSNWTFSGPNALDGESSNDAATTPFPMGRFADDGGEAAEPALIISEIWPGQAGSDLTEDWFEITNVGEVAWENVALGALFYDDDSQDPTDATKIENITSIAPGESAVVVVGDSADANEWGTVWGDDIDLTNLQVGWTDGSGLSNGGDAVTLFLRDEPEIGQDPNDGLNADDIIDVATYPDADGNSGRAWEVAAAEFATLEGFEDTVATTQTAGDSGEEPAIASPGFIPTEGERIEHTLISAIQGTGFASPLVDQTVSVSAVVTLVSDQLNGFFLQEEDADADGDEATSEGVFVYTGSDPSVEVGNRVSFSATVGEYFDATQLSGLQDLVVEAESVDLPTAATVTLPLADGTDPAAFYERIEGMRVTVTAGEGEPLTVTDTYTRFGEVGVTSGDPLMQPTQVHASFSTEAEALAEANARDYLMFENAEDDSLSSAPRVGDGIVGNAINGVMHYTFGDYKVETQGAVEFDPSVNPNPRPDTPEAIEGRLKVASFNVLNYFTTLTSEDSDARGASTAQELADQTAKIVAAISAIDADILGLMEIENDLGDVDDEAVAALVNALNAELGAGTYDYIATGKVGDDAIKQAVIYKPEAVTPVGDSAVLDSEAFIDPLGAGRDLNRPALAQSFEENGTGEVFTVSVNHLKSKGSETGVVVDGEPDDTEVEGSAALTRVAAAEELADWLATDPTGSGDPDQLTLGDFNAYSMERAIQALEADGFTNLADADAIAYQFDGRLGTLDYAFANDSLLDQVQDYTIWNVNSLEAHAQQYSSFQFDALGDPTSPFGSSDHDPVIVGLDLQAPEPERLLVEGTSGRDYLVGTDDAEIIAGRGGFGDLLVGRGGEDVFYFDTIGDGARDYARVLDFEAGIDGIQLESDDYDVLLTSRYARIDAGQENDLILVGGYFETVDALGINVGPIDGLVA